jgi:hypothetical protein
MINTALYPAMMWNGRFIHCRAIHLTTRKVSGSRFLKMTRAFLSHRMFYTVYTCSCRPRRTCRRQS